VKRRTAAGFTLLEVLVALAVIALSMGAMKKMSCEDPLYLVFQ